MRKAAFLFSYMQPTAVPATNASHLTSATALIYSSVAFLLYGAFQLCPLSPLVRTACAFLSPGVTPTVCWTSSLTWISPPKLSPLINAWGMLRGSLSEIDRRRRSSVVVGDG